MGQEVLVSISIIIGIASILAIFARMIRQPPIIAYLIAGIIVGPLALNLLGPQTEFSSIINVFAHIGVALLLFIVGLSLDLRVLKEVGGVATFSGIAEIILAGGIGTLIALGIGFGSVEALYIGAALAFSSTVVIVKILSDKKEIDTLHGRIALGILIVEDFVAAIALMAIPLLQGSGGFEEIAKSLGLVILLIAAIFLISNLFLTKFLNYLARNQEALFLFGIAWALVISTLFDKLGFSLEIGALIAGMALASSKYTLELGGKIKPLRDFFVVLFFVYFGSQLAGNITLTLIGHALLFSAFVLIGKPLIVMTVLRVAGYKKRTNFLAGSSIAQISEFSLILVLLGFNLGYLTQEIMSLAVLIAVVTIGISSYSIYYAHSIFNKISHLLNIFESKKHRLNVKKKEEKYDVILFGYHRIGYRVLQELKKSHKSFVVIDYNPKVILSLGEAGINCIYGDANDKEFLTEIPIDKASLIISTIPEESANLMIRERLRECNTKAAFIATAEQPRTALDLYKEGIDYVLIPHHLGGDYAAYLIEKLGTSKSKYKEKGQEHKKELQKAKNSSNFV